MGLAEEEKEAEKNHTTSTTTRYSWGRRPFPLPPNRTVLVLGNSHLRQVSKTMVCQYANVIQSLDHHHHHHHAAAAHININHNNNDTDDVFVVQFTNGARWISITNTVLVYSKDWMALLQDEYLTPMDIGITGGITGGGAATTTKMIMTSRVDAIVFGKFTRYAEAQHTNFETTMKFDQERYDYDYWRTKQQQQQRGRDRDRDHVVNNNDSGEESRTTNNNNNNDVLRSRTIDFATIPPPQLVDVVRALSIIRSSSSPSSQQNHSHSHTKTTTTTTSFEYPPPSILSVPMFSLADLPRARHEREEYYQQFPSVTTTKRSTGSNSSNNNNSNKRPTTSTSSSNSNSNSNTITQEEQEQQRLLILPQVQFLDTRQYIDALGLECGSDDKLTMGTCHEPGNDYVGYSSSSNTSSNTSSSNTSMMPRNPADMHRCAGPFGGHADLVAFSMVEALHELLLLL
jgi:hypothetical protein